MSNNTNKNNDETNNGEKIKSHLKKFIQICKRYDINVIKLIQDDIKNNVPEKTILEKYEISEDEINSSKQLVLFTEETLDDIYLKYHNIKKRGGNPKFSLSKIKMPNTSKIFGSVKSQAKRQIDRNKDKLTQHVQEQIDSKVDDVVEGVAAGATFSLFNLFNSTDQASHTQEAEDQEPTVKPSSKSSESTKLSDKTDTQSNTQVLPILKSVHKQVTELPKKIDDSLKKEFVAASRELDKKLEETEKALTKKILDEIQDKLNDLVKDIIPEIKEIVKDQFDEHTKQTGGSKEVNDVTIICKCCDCAKDGYIFSDIENDEKCTK